MLPTFQEFLAAMGFACMLLALVLLWDAERRLREARRLHTEAKAINDMATDILQKCYQLQAISEPMRLDVDPRDEFKYH